MTEEEKQLLLIDLCARLPYETHIYIEFENGNILDNTVLNAQYIYDWMVVLSCQNISIKPYLRPMSSMTKKDMDKLNQYVGDRFIFKDGMIYADENFHHEGYLYSDHEDYVDIIDWLNAHHFDYRGLIEKDLALEAPEGMYKIE